MGKEARFAITVTLLNRVSLGVVVCVVLLAIWRMKSCDPGFRKSDAALGLNPQQAVGRKVYDDYCDRCHEAYSSRDKKGPSLQSVFKRQYLSVSGLPANDKHVTEIVKFGRAKMQGLGRVLNDQQINDLLAYLHTL